MKRAETEYESFRKTQLTLPQPVDEHFEATLDKLKKLAKARPLTEGKPEKKTPTKKTKPLTSNDE